MKTNIFKIFALTVLITVSSCKQTPTEISFSDYKYGDKEQVIACANNAKLLNEALYSFEDDIINKYDPNNKNLVRAYSSFGRLAMTNRAPIVDIASEHTQKLFNSIKTSGLYINGSLDYNSPEVKCIADNISNPDLKTTFNALISTNSFDTKIFTPALRTQLGKLSKDKYLGLYVALDLFYGNMFNVDFSKATKPAPKAPAASQQKKEAPKKDAHSGHNH